MSSKIDELIQSGKILELEKRNTKSQTQEIIKATNFRGVSEGLHAIGQANAEVV